MWTYKSYDVKFVIVKSFQQVAIRWQIVATSIIGTNGISIENNKGQSSESLQ